MAHALLGGVLIGASASLLLAFNGRIAGISGIVGELIVPRRGEVGWRLAFVAGLLAGGVALAGAMPEAFAPTATRSWPAIAAAGLLVGVGTRLGNGCTSGHGVCGIPRGSARSIAATVTFMATGMLTVFAVGLLGGTL